MKRQLLPLLLCLFVVLFAFNNAIYAINNLQQNEYKSFENQHFKDLDQVNSTFDFNEFNNTNFFNNNININDVFRYYSETSNFGGISTIKEFSYNFIDKKQLGSKTIITPIQYQGNLFNQGLFYGFALTIVLLNLVCFFVFDEILFVKFSATVAALTVALFFAEGLFPLIGIDGLLQNYMMQSTLLLIAIGLHSLFTDKYLTIKECYPKLSQISLAAFGFAFLLLITSWINGSESLTSIVNIILFSVLSFYFIAGVLLFSKKNYAKFYVIGTFIPLLFFIDYFLLKPLGIEFLFTEAVHLKVATLFEVLLLSYAIMYRMQAVKEEGELRQTEMRIFLKRQDVMTRNQVEQLVEDVYLENLIMQYDLDGLEIKLLQYISEGKENTKIARKLKLTEVEVVDYTKDLYKKLEISEHIQEDYRLLDNQPDYIYN
tara:strand:- start:7816 stop:9105 length:1290 start_codon:yes stop_codon:yes gene_type:complete